MRTYEDIRSAFVKYDVPGDIADRAAKNVASREVVLLAVSGKMGSGKDTLAPQILDRLGYENREQHSYAAALKTEVGEVIALFQATPETPEAELVKRLTAAQNILADDATMVVRTLRQEVLDGTVTSGYDRTPAVRKVLQQWGTEIRRTQDPQYWVKKAVKNIALALAEGKSAYSTDVRFVNEAESVLECGGLLPRVEISRETQDARILGRDGITMSEDARLHRSETDLDGFEGFTIALPTDTLTVEETVNALTDKMSNELKGN